ncbi:MAG TPA: TonB-dependent receptor [Acidobacteriaceae bacterium]
MNYALFDRWYRRFVVIVSLSILLAAAQPFPLHAQQGTGQSPAGKASGTITGTVQDPRGEVLQNVPVTVRGELTGIERKAMTGSQGRFSVSELPVGSYAIEVSAPGFGSVNRTGVQLGAGQTQNIPISLSLGSVAQEVTVEAADSNSLAAQLSPVQALLDAGSARSEISGHFIRYFVSPVADYTEVLQIAPGTFSVNSNGVGLGQSSTYFRGFSDGNYDITWDGIPYNDTNSPTHHSWAFFPSPWLGGVDFDRSPGTASTIGPTPFGGSINLLSKPIPAVQSGRAGVSYGSFNTILTDGQYDSPALGANRKTSLSLDVHRMTSDGFQTYNYQKRNAGEIKVQYQFSEKSVLTGFSGVVMLDSNTPNSTAPTRAQVAQYGYNFLLQGTDPTSPYYYKYNTYHLPTDFEYVGYRSELGHGWLIDAKPYTYSYYNAQYYTNAAPTNASGLIDASCAKPVTKKGVTALPCAIDKLNSYRKYGEAATVSQVSKFGIFRIGLWYEWATTNRYQVPSNPLTRQDQVLPNFHERFYTNSYQPFAEYEYNATGKLTLRGGAKYAYYNQNLTQYADNGKTVGSLGGAPSVNHSAGYSSWLPAADANYRLTSNWSAYGQFAQGSVIPPSSVFDVKNGAVQTLPKPSKTTTYQAGSVIKVKRFTLDADVYRIKFQNPYSSFTPPSGGEPIYYLGPDSITKGFEGETNVALSHGVSLYANGTVGKATYTGRQVPSNLWVQFTPSNTEALGLTYQQKYLDLGFFEKRVGPMYNDNGAYHNQVSIASFNTVSMFFNYTLRNGSRFDNTQLRLSFNNLLNAHDVVGVTSANAPVPLVVSGAASPYLATTAPAGGDLLTQTPGRSVMMSVTFGITSKKER